MAGQSIEEVAILHVIPRQALWCCLAQVWWVTKAQRSEDMVVKQAETTHGSWEGCIISRQRPKQSLAACVPITRTN